jgi:hypothetical protein
VVKVDEHVLGPKHLPELIPGDDLLRTVEQAFQGAEGQVLDLDPNSVLAEFSRVHVGFEDPEAD